MARDHFQAPEPTEFPKLAEPAVGHHRHPAGHGHGELVVPAEPGECADRTDPRILQDQRVDEWARLGGSLAPPDARARRQILGEVDHADTRWISVPVPRPPPQHIVTSPRSPSRRSSSATRVAISLAPVAPTA